VRRRLPPSGVSLEDEQLRGIEGGEHGEQIRGRGIRGQLEFPSGQVEPCGVEAPAIHRHGGQVAVAGGVHLAGGEGCPGREDARQAPPDEAAGLGGLLLVAKGHLPPGGEELAHIAVRCVERDARHGRVLALGERQPEQPRGRDGVVEEHLVEVAEPEQQQGVRRKPALHLEVLLHHRGCLFGLGHRGGWEKVERGKWKWERKSAFPSRVLKDYDGRRNDGSS